MAGFLSKERRLKRTEYFHKLGRRKFSLMFSFLFIIFSTFFSFIIEVLFENPFVFSDFFNYDLLSTNFFAFVIFFLLSYYFFWNGIKKQYEKDK